MTQSIFVASRKGLFRFDPGANSWTAGAPSFIGEPVTAVLSDPRDGTLYAALNLGHFGIKVHRSEDRGVTWTEVALPTLPSGEGETEKQPAVEMIWTLVPGGSDEPGVLWAGTIPGALFRSDDRGDSWTLNEALWNQPSRKDWFGGGYDQPGLHTVLVDPRDSRKLTLAISSAGVWKTDDGGGSWRNTGQGLRAEYMPPELTHNTLNQDVHRLAVSADDPEIVWCQHHNGIFRSTDGAETFTEITDVKPSVFGFSVAAHPLKSGVAWFVPAVKDECRIPVDGKLVVNRTVDNGATFQANGEGLPSEDCYDLMYRHALDVDDTGEVLVIGSTTGSLWVSADGGRAWSLVTAHLPPIAQVAFG